MKPGALEEKVFAVATGALLADRVDPAITSRFVRDFYARAPWHVALGLRRMLLLTWLASPLLLVGRVRTFFGVDEETRAEIWRRALDHRYYTVRQLALVIKALSCMCQFDDDAAHAPSLSLIKEGA